MTIKFLFKLWVASLCAVFACYLPQSLARTQEIGISPVSSYKPISGLSTLQAQTFPPLSQTPDEAASKAFIYEHESGNNPAAVNSIGCRGLGQACPGNKLPCGADYACQDQWFNSYMLERYGSWTHAKQMWLSQYDANGQHWW